MSGLLVAHLIVLVDFAPRRPRRPSLQPKLVRICANHTMPVRGCVSIRVIRTKAMDSFEKRLTEAVRRKREAEGLSIRALSAVVGISFSTLARIERGDGLPDNNSKIRWLEWLGPEARRPDLRSTT